MTHHRYIDLNRYCEIIRNACRTDSEIGECEPYTDFAVTSNCIEYIMYPNKFRPGDEERMRRMDNYIQTILNEHCDLDSTVAIGDNISQTWVLRDNVSEENMHRTYEQHERKRRSARSWKQRALRFFDRKRRVLYLLCVLAALGAVVLAAILGPEARTAEGFGRRASSLPAWDA
jgi:hypothetical protein